jgi:multidrug efflux pump subunit AcrA (membrane-fusion protein)
MNKKYLLLPLALVLAAAAIYLVMRTKSEDADEGGKVEKKRYIKSVYASGYVDSVNKVLIRPEVSGYIERIFVEEGDAVTKGQVIAVIRNDKLKEELKEIEAKKKLVQERMAPSSDYIQALKDEVEIWKLNTEIERKNFERREELFGKGIISRETYDQAQQSLEVAKRNYTKAQAELNDATSSLDSEFNSLSAAEDAVKREMEKHQIKSPVDGRVLRKFAEEGDYVNSVMRDDDLFSVGDPNDLETDILVDEEYVPLVKVGQKVLVTTDAYPDKVFEGNVTVIEREADRTSRTVKVKADVDYPGNIPVGITIEANIIIEDKEGLFISKDAYKNGSVSVVRDGKTLRIPVKSGFQNEEYIEITDGVDEDEEIAPH